MCFVGDAFEFHFKLNPWDTHQVLLFLLRRKLGSRNPFLQCWNVEFFSKLSGLSHELCSRVFSIPGEISYVPWCFQYNITALPSCFQKNGSQNGRTKGKLLLFVWHDLLNDHWAFRIHVKNVNFQSGDCDILQYKYWKLHLVRTQTYSI